MINELGIADLKKAPTLITADFDGNKLHDYAVILEGDIEGKILVIFRQTSKGIFKPYELYEAGDFIEEKEPNTVIKEWDSSHSIKLKY